MNNAIKLGSISTTLAGDGNYTDRLEVLYLADTIECAKVQIIVWSYTPRGGMDGDPTPLKRAHHEADLSGTCTGKELITAVKKVLGKSCYNFSRYGKPTKNFSWIDSTSEHGARGLSAKLAQHALGLARQAD